LSASGEGHPVENDDKPNPGNAPSDTAQKPATTNTDDATNHPAPSAGKPTPKQPETANTDMTDQIPLFGQPQDQKTSDDYYTPKWIFEALNLRFDIDVAAPPKDATGYQPTDTSPKPTTD